MRADSSLRVRDSAVSRASWCSRFDRRSRSLHPDGLHLCLAFDNRLSLSHIGLDALLPWRELPLPSVRQALYSNGGHLLLAAQAKSVVVFESYSLNRVAVCSAHLAPITALAWSADDTAFTSGGNDGMFYTWSAEQMGKRVGECRLYKGAGVSDLAVLSEARKPIDDDMAQAQVQASRRGGGKGGEAEPEHTVIVVGGEPHHPRDHHSKEVAMEAAAAAAAAVAAAAAAAAAAVGSDVAPGSVLRLIERSYEQSELPLGGDSLCRVVTLPKAKLAFVGTLGGAVHSVACGGAMPGAFEKLMPKGAPVRPHLGAVSALLPLAMRSCSSPQGTTDRSSSLSCRRVATRRPRARGDGIERGSRGYRVLLADSSWAW